MKSFSEVNEMNGNLGIRPDEHPAPEANESDLMSTVKAPNDSAKMKANGNGDRETRMNNPGRYS